MTMYRISLAPFYRLPCKHESGVKALLSVPQWSTGWLDINTGLKGAVWEPCHFKTLYIQYGLKSSTEQVF